MLKKILSGLLVFGIILSLCACGNSNTNNNANTNGMVAEENVKHSGKKIKGEITQGTIFSEGLAFVCLDGNKEKTYCINKEGYIVFEIDEKIRSYEMTKYVNGYALVNDYIYDTAGKCITPESVNASKFYDIALKGGYILAEKITAYYSSSKKELGVLNKKFEWIVKPSEALYKNLENELYHITALNRCSFYFNDYVCFQDNASFTDSSNITKYLNLKTGEITETVDFKTPSYGLFPSGNSTFEDYQANIVIDLSKHSNITYIVGSEYKKGKVPVYFKNSEVGTNYFTFADENANFVFEPKEIKNMNQVGKFCFDGENLLIVDSATDANHIQSYNINGEFLGELKPETLGYASYSCEINNEVIYVEGGYNNSRNGYYFSTDFKELF